MMPGGSSDNLAYSSSPAEPSGPPSIPGLKIQAEIGRGAQSLVYRVIREGRAYALKVPRMAEGSRMQETMAQFRREAAILARVVHPVLPEILEIGEHEGRPYLIMELLEGRNLASRIATGGALNENALFSLARHLASALARVHDFGLIHRDIKPRNVLLDSSGTPRLIDFGFATETSRSPSSDSGDPESAVGTFLYCSPEQAGFLRRPVDARSDLYSLGAMLHECATGRPPFSAAGGAGELIRQHGTVPPPGIPTLSPLFDRIIRKLLAKDPDDRYQSGQGLVADLDALEELNAESRLGREPMLGRNDRRVEVFSGIPLMGRERELAELQAAWDGALGGRGSMLLVEGEPGSGKSRLIRELMERARKSGGIAIHCKCEQGSQIPFGPIRRAVEDYLRELRGLPARERVSTEELLRSEAGESGSLLRDFFPSLAPLFPDTPGLKSSVEALDIFPSVVSRFLTSVARMHRGLLWVIDDVQWLDESSLQVLRRLSERLEGAGMLVACSGRSDSESAEKLEKFRQGARSALGGRVRLEALGEEAVGRLMQAHLGGKPVEPGFVKGITVRSQGSPLAVTEYLRAMLSAGLLRPSWGSWVVDAERLEKLELPTDVVQLIVRRLDDLSTETRVVLSTMAALGERFDEELLEPVTGLRPELVRMAVQEAARANLIERNEAGLYAFVHDKVQEAMLSGMSGKDRRALHQRITEKLEQLRGPVVENLEFSYMLARQASLGETEKDPERVYRSNLDAGKKALENHGAQAAYPFLKIAEAHLPPGDAPGRHELDALLGEACFGANRLAEATAYLESAIRSSLDPRIKVGLLARLASAYMINGEGEKGGPEIVRAFDLMGWRKISNDPISWLITLGSGFAYLAKSLLGIGFGSAKGAHRDDLKTIVQLLDRFLVASYLDLKMMDWFQAALRMHAAAYRIGPSRELVFDLVLQAASIAAMWGQSLGIQARIFPGALSVIPRWVNRRIRARISRILGQASATATKLGDPIVIAHAEAYRAIAFALLADPDGEKLTLAALEKHEAWLSIPDHSYLMGSLGLTLEPRGYVHEMLSYTQKFLQRLELEETPLIPPAHLNGCLAYTAILGRRRESQEYSKRLDQQRILGIFNEVFRIRGVLTTLLEDGELGAAADEALRRADAVPISPLGSPQFFRYSLVLCASMHLRQAEAAEGERRGLKLRQARRAVRKLRWAASIPLFQAYWMVLEAFRLRLEGRHRGAMKLLSRAHELNYEIEAPVIRFEVARQRAHVLRETGHPTEAEREARMAHELALGHGWIPRAGQVARTFSLDLQDEAPLPAVSDRNPPTPVSVATRRQMDALLQLSLVSSDVFDPEALAGVALSEIVRALGAERAFLFLCDEAGGTLVMKTGRDSGGNELRELTGYSRTVIERVRLSRKPLVLSASDEGEVKVSHSMVAHNLRSLMAAPLLIRDKLLGVVYLDSRLAKGIFGEEDVSLLLGLASHIAISLESARAAQVELKRQGLEKDLELAGAVQTLLLPEQELLEVGGMKLASFYQPASRLGGDWWWHDSRPGGALRLLIGDVTGHGPGAAMMTAAVAGAYRTLQAMEPSMPVERLLSFLNDYLIAISKDTYSMTMSVLELDPGSRRGQLWNAGGSPLFRLGRSGQLEPILAASTPLGSARFESAKVSWEWKEGERLFMFTDGLHSFTTIEGKRFSFLKLQKLLAETSRMGLLEAKSHVAGQVLALQPAATGPEDDITLLVVDFER